MRIGHISDLHLLDLSDAKWHDFLNKRWTGGLNLLLGRAQKHHPRVVKDALEKLHELCDHLVISGDLTNLAFESEFNAAQKLISNYFTDSQLTFVPGNHDQYLISTVRDKLFERCVLKQDSVEWPTLRFLSNNIAIIGLNSARPRPWFVASGKLGGVQLQRLEDVLQQSEVASKFRILILHHHVFREKNTPGECFRNLRDHKEFCNILKKYSVNMVLFGHNHSFFAKKWHDTLFFEPGSCSIQRAKDENHFGKFNIYHINEGGFSHFETWRYENGTYQHWKNMNTEDIKIIV